MKKLVLAAILVLVTAGSALALPWRQSWTVTGEVTGIEAVMVLGNIDFLPPGMVDFLPSANAATWQVGMIHSKHIMAWGEETPLLNFTTWFSDNTPFAIHWALYDHSGLVESVRFDWDGYSWISGPMPREVECDRNPPGAPVPEPATIILMGLGLAGAILVRQRATAA